MSSATEIHVGVSSCLLGQEVRYDGGHAYDPFVAQTLGNVLTLVSICPEDELGMGTPRETVRLVGEIDTPRMVGTHSVKDWTAPMNRWAITRARALAADQLCGYVFKRNSPSCGVNRVKVYPDQGRFRRQGRGLFAAEFARRYPLVPLEEEVRLQDPVVRENFVVRVFALKRLQQVFQGRWRKSDLVLFHDRETELLQAHDAKGLKQLDQIVALVTRTKPAVFRDQYMAAFMAILAKTATPRKHARVLRQLAGFLKPHLAKDEHQILKDRIEEYRLGKLPLLAPMTLLSHLGQLHNIDECRSPSYLNPDPRELMLRNHA